MHLYRPGFVQWHHHWFCRLWTVNFKYLAVEWHSVLKLDLFHSATLEVNGILVLLLKGHFQRTCMNCNDFRKSNHFKEAPLALHFSLLYVYKVYTRGLAPSLRRSNLLMAFDVSRWPPAALRMKIKKAFSLQSIRSRLFGSPYPLSGWIRGIPGRDKMGISFILVAGLLLRIFPGSFFVFLSSLQNPRKNTSEGSVNSISLFFAMNGMGPRRGPLNPPLIPLAGLILEALGLLAEYFGGGLYIYSSYLSKGNYQLMIDSDDNCQPLNLDAWKLIQFRFCSM